MKNEIKKVIDSIVNFMNVCGNEISATFEKQLHVMLIILETENMRVTPVPTETPAEQIAEQAEQPQPETKVETPVEIKCEHPIDLIETDSRGISKCHSCGQTFVI